MKFLVFLLSAYVVVISTTTCCGDYGMHHPEYPTEYQSHETDAHDCDGACSPFCVCSVCPGFTNQTFTHPFQQKIQESIPQENTFYLSHLYLSPLLNGVWQPPQEN
jgi:hypothetical protein